MSAYCFNNNKTIALVTCFWHQTLHSSAVSLACQVPAHVWDTYLFVALDNHRFQKTTGREVTWNFSWQVFVSTFPCAHEADNRPNACFHERDAWCVSLSATIRMNMLSARNFGRGSAVLLTTTRLRSKLLSRLSTQNGHQSRNGTCVMLFSLLAVSVGGSRVRKARELIVSPEMSSCLA